MTQSPLEKLLAAQNPLMDNSAARTGFTIALMASDLFVPVEEDAATQAQAGGVSLKAIDIEGAPHVLLFTSQKKLTAFTSVGTRFARACGKDIFPHLRGAYAVLNPGTEGRQFTPEDIASVLGDMPACGAPGHVHSPDCGHA